MNLSKIVKKSGLYFVGNFASKIMVGLLVPIYAGFVSPYDLGVYDYLQTIMNVVTSIAYMAIWEAVLRFIIGETNENQNKNALSIVVYSLFISVFFFLLTFFISYYFYSSILIAVMMSVMYVMYGMANIWNYFARAYGETNTYIFSGIIGTITNFLTVIITVCYLRLGLIGLIFSYSFSRIVAFFIIESKLHLLRLIRKHSFSMKLILSFIKYSGPLVLNIISSFLLSGLASIVIINKFGPTYNGLYSFASKFPLLLISIGSIMVMALTEEAILEIKNEIGYSNISYIFNKLIVTAVSIGIMALPIIRIYYCTISNSEYYTSIDFVPFMIIYAIVSVISSLYGSIFQAIDKTKYQFTTTLVGGIITTVVIILFVKKFQLWAIVFSQVAGYLTMLLTRVKYTSNYIKIKIDKRCSFILTVIFIANTFIYLYLDSIFIFIITFVMNCICLCILNKDIVSKIFNKVKGLRCFFD